MIYKIGYSCDGVVAGRPNDGIDRLSGKSTIGDRPGKPHAWIVLLLDNGAQRLIDDDESRVVNYYSPKCGFVGGTIYARPTASDEIIELKHAIDESSSSP